MKKTLITTLATLGIAASAMAQGTIAFSASGTTGGVISYSTDGATVVGYPKSPGIGSYGNVTVGFYTAPNGTVLSLGNNGLPDFTGWTFSTSTLSISAAGGGRTGSTTIFTTGAGSAPVEFEVVGWTGAATSWAAAVTAQGQGTPELFGYSGEKFNGTTYGALGWSQATGDPNATPFPITPANAVTGAGGYNGLVMSTIPEPSTIALGGLGAAALLMFRRRK